MKLKTMALLAAISITGMASASYNSVIYIPTSVEYDVERTLMMNLQFIPSHGRNVNYWNKSAFKSLCKYTDSTLKELKGDVEKISEKFLVSSELFRHKGKADINKSILKLETTVQEGLQPILDVCKSEKRLKEDRARELTSDLAMMKVKNKFYTARNELSKKVKAYGEVIRAYDQADTSRFNGKYEGHQGAFKAFAPCQVEMKVEGKHVKMLYKDSDSKFEMTRELARMSADKKVLKNFDFDTEIKTNTICSSRGTTFAKLNFENNQLVDFKATHRMTKRQASGLGVIISCISQEDETLKNIFADKYKCYDLKMK